MKKLILLIIPFLLCGCNGDLNRKEIDEINMAHLMGIDYSDGEFTITIIYNSATSGGQEEVTLEVISGVGATAYQAFEDIKLKNKKTVSIAHTGFYLIGDEAARNGIDLCLDFIARDETIKMEALVFVTKDMSAKDFIDQSVEDEQLIHEDLKAINIKQLEFLKRNDNTIVNILNEMEYVYSSLLIPYIISEEEMFLIDGYAAFHQLKLQDYLDNETSTAINFVKNIIRRYPIFLNGEVGLLVTNVKSNVQSNFQNEDLLVRIRIEFETIVKEVITREDIFYQEKLIDLTNSQNQYITEIIEKAVNYSIASRMDVLQIARMIENQNAREWNRIEGNWTEYLGNIRYQYDVRSRILQSYIIGNER